MDTINTFVLAAIAVGAAGLLIVALRSDDVDDAGASAGEWHPIRPNLWLVRNDGTPPPAGERQPSDTFTAEELLIILEQGDR